MTSEYIEFRDGDQLKKIEFESIEKMYYGENPHPKKLHIVMVDYDEDDIPEWILDEFEDVPEKISEFAGLTKTKGPELEKTWMDKLKGFADVSFKVMFLGIAGTVLIADFILFFIAGPCCFGPFWIISLIGIFWLGYEIFGEQEIDKQVWEKKEDR